MWSVNFNQNRVEVYDAQSLAVVTNINIGSFPSDLVLDQLNRKAYVLKQDFFTFPPQVQLFEINAVDFTVRSGPVLTDFFPNGGFFFGFGAKTMVVSAFGQVLVSGFKNGVGNGLQVFSTSALEATQFVTASSLGASFFFPLIIPSADQATAWMGSSSTVLEIDLQTLTTRRQLNVGGFAMGLAVNEGRNELYALLSAFPPQLTVVDLTTGNVLRTISFPGYFSGFFFSGSTMLTPGLGPQVYLNMTSESTFQQVLLLVDTEQGTVLNPALVSGPSILSMESLAGDARLFLSIYPSMLKLLEGPTGITLQESSVVCCPRSLAFLLMSSEQPTVSCTDEVTVDCSPAAGKEVPVTVHLTDPDGDGLLVTWKVDDVLQHSQNVPAEGPPTSEDVTFTYTYAPGDHTLEVTVTDGISDAASCTIAIHVTTQDLQNPTISCPGNQTLDCTAGNGAVATFAPTASDACDPNPTVTCAPPSGSIFLIGTTTVTCTARDAGNNTASCAFQITVQDTVAPTISCPADQTLPCTGNAGPVATYAPTASDNCDTSPTITCSPPSGSAFGAGTNTVTCTARDDANNATACSFRIIVPDEIPPVITCPTNLVLCPNPSTGQAVVNYPGVTATDNCGPPAISCVPPAGSVLPLGATNATCTATDALGNSDECTFPVQVEDVTPPAVACPGDIVTNADAHQCSRSNVTFSVTATDNCGSATVVCEPPSGSTFSLGTNTVTCTATDPFLNQADCAFRVIVIPQGITLSPVVTGLTNPSGIDNHQASTQLVLSVNYPTGQPHNLEVVAPSGSRHRHSNAGQLPGRIEIAAVQDTLGGFAVGEILLGNGIAGQIARVSADGNTLTDPWVTLPGESGLVGGLHVDRTGLFGGDLIAVTSAGSVWRVTAGGAATQLAILGVGLRGVTTVADDAAKYGPWAGRVVVGSEQSGIVYAINAQGSVTSHSLGITAEDLEVIPLNENFYGVDFGDRIVWGAALSQFEGMVGDILAAQETPGILYRIRWTGSSFCVIPIAQVDRWQGITFSSVGIGPIPPAVHTPSVSCPSPRTAEACPSAPGTTVGLTATVNDPDGDTLTVTWQVNGGAPLQVDTVVLDGPSVGKNVSFTNLYAFGANTVTVTVADDDDSATCSTTVTVNPETAPPSFNCKNITISHDPGSCSATVNSYTNVTASDNCSASAVVCAPPAPHTFPPGTTAVNCSATDELGNVNNCYFSVTVLGPSAAFSVPQSVCANATNQTAAVPDAGAGATYTWTISNGAITAGQGTRAIVWAAAAVGPVTLGVTVTDAGGCTVSETHSMAVNARADATITAPASLCGNTTNHTASVADAGVGAQYVWGVTNGAIVSGHGTRAITFNTGPTGPVVLTLSVANAADCAASSSHSIAINCVQTDTDGDGLTNDDEINVHLTDPLKADTDEDGLNDGEEVLVYGTNPLNPDTDCDGTYDGDEVAVGSSPTENATGSCCRRYEKFDTVSFIFPYVNIAASGRGTIIRIDANTGEILGEYLTSPEGRGRNPSRTTVDRLGNVWVGNRAEESGGKGSVARIGIVIGGTRGKKNPNGSFTPDPEGQYLKGPFQYSTCVDRDGDGLIKTSRSLADILPWSNVGDADSNGGVSTAEDECIINYVRVAGTGTRTVAVDAHNDVWVGGHLNTVHEKLDGVTGEPIPGTQFALGCGGYGGVVDQNGVLWSARSGSGLLRFEPNLDAPPAGTGQCLGLTSGYGLGLDPNSGHVWHSGYGSPLIEFDEAGNILNSYDQPFGAQGVCVDAHSHVWMAQAFGNSVWHLAPDPNDPSRHVEVGIVSGFAGSTGVAVDSNGKIWVGENNNRASRIDPTAGPVGGGGYRVGAIDLSVDLGAGAAPYNYSDMTGFISKNLPGILTVTHDSGADNTRWGTVSWNASTPSNSAVRVTVRTSNDLADLKNQLPVEVNNGVTFTTVADGRYLHAEITLINGPSGAEPTLHSLTICTANGFDAPPVAVCQDVTTNLPPGSTVATVAAGQVNNGSTDPENQPLKFRLEPSDRFPVGTNDCALIVTDVRGQSSSCAARVIVTGSASPTIFCPPNLLVSADPGACTASGVLLGWPIIGDDLGIEDLGNDAPSLFALGTNLVTWTVTDTDGNAASCVQAVVVRDTEPPSLLCPPSVTIDPNPGTTFASSASLAAPSATDNCAFAILTNNAPSQLSIGSHLVAWTAVDTSGNSSQCSQTVIVRDPIAPEVECSIQTSQLEAPATATALVRVTQVETNPPTVHCSGDLIVECQTNRTGKVNFTVTATDDCDVAPTFACLPPSGSVFGLGVTTVTCTGEDASGNTNSCSFDVTVLDRIAPAILCPSNLLVECTGYGGGAATYSATATDACDPNPTISCTPPSGSTFPAGTNTVTCTARDESLNTNTCTFAVVVRDSQPPSIVCPSSQIIECVGNGTATATYSATASDTCDDNPTVACSPPSGSSFAVGTTTVTCTATDGGGNHDSCSFTVTVRDTTPPSITCPSDQSLACVSADGSPLHFNITATDTCDTNVTVGCAPPSGAIFPKGATTVTCTATDHAGNSTSCSFTVNVVATTAPTIACPANIVTNTAAGQCSRTVTFSATAESACDPNPTVTCSPESGSAFAKGTNTVTCIATDHDGHSTNCSFTVTVLDLQAPAITCPSNQTVVVTNNCAVAGPAVFTEATANDNCPGVTILCVPSSGSVLPPGPHAVTCTATDTSGNTNSCSFSVTVLTASGSFECAQDGAGQIVPVTVSSNVVIDFNTTPPTYSGDPALQPFVSYDTNGPTANQWKAVFDVGAKKLVIKNGATLTVAQVPPTSNNRRAPGIVIQSKCGLEVEPGGAIVVESLNLPAGDILVKTVGGIVINGSVRNALNGTAPSGAVPGAITLSSRCGGIVTGPSSRIETIGNDPGGSDINLLACDSGNIVVNGLVRALFKYHGAQTHLPVINAVAANGAVTVDGNNDFGNEVIGGTTYRITSGLWMLDYLDQTSGTIKVQALHDVTVLGNIRLHASYYNFGALATSAKANGAFGGLIDVRSLQGKIVASDRAFDNANDKNANARINLFAAQPIELSVTSRLNAGASNNAKAVVTAQGHATQSGAVGGTVTLRSYAGGVNIGANAQVLATGKTNGTNLVISCTGVANSGTVSPADAASGDDSGACAPSAPDPLYPGCGSFGITYP